MSGVILFPLKKKTRTPDPMCPCGAPRANALVGLKRCDAPSSDEEAAEINFDRSLQHARCSC